MIRRRPIPKARFYPAESLRYSTILGGAVRVYPDGRQVCQDNFAGRREYLRRLEIMLTRQNFRCCLCGERIRAKQDATFEHSRRRGMGSAFRDDRVYDAEGRMLNGAAHWVCNGERD